MTGTRKAARSPGKRATIARSKASAGDASIADDPRTEGQRLLIEVSGSHTEVGAAIGASKQSVQEWRSGRKTPAQAARLRIRDAFGIEPEAWSRVPSSAVPPRELPELGGELDHLEELLRDLRALRADRNLTASERARVAGEETKTLRRIAELRDAERLTQARYVHEHPAWLALRAEILDALKPFPDAYRALVARLEARGA